MLNTFFLFSFLLEITIDDYVGTWKVLVCRDLDAGAYYECQKQSETELNCGFMVAGEFAGTNLTDWTLTVNGSTVTGDLLTGNAAGIYYKFGDKREIIWGYFGNLLFGLFFKSVKQGKLPKILYPILKHYRFTI